jgi:hypothetical protein
MQTALSNAHRFFRRARRGVRIGPCGCGFKNACLPLVMLCFFASRALPASAPTTGPTAAPTTTPSGFGTYLDRELEAEREAQAEYNSMTPTATVRRDALARLFMDDGRLAIEIGGMEVPELARINVSDADGVWLALRKSGRFGRNGRLNPSLQLNRYDFDQTDPAALWVTYLSVGRGLISLSGESLRRRIIFSENPDRIFLTIVEKDPEAPPESAHPMIAVRSLPEMRNNYPAEYREFLLPLIGKLTDVSKLLPGPTDVYEVFPDIPADDASSRELQSLLLAADSTVPAERDKARAQMEAMGARGILAAMRMDTANLTPEQQTAVSALIAEGRRAKVPDATAAKHDLDFLLDCMEMDAPGAKGAALRELKKVTGKPLALDPNSRGPEALAAVDALRKQLLGDPATTEPSE